MNERFLEAVGLVYGEACSRLVDAIRKNEHSAEWTGLALAIEDAWPEYVEEYRKRLKVETKGVSS